ncbi:urea amidolyase family protein [Mesorhizobium sp.]|uniref:5-oxoprolinase subunit B/C family protein n=1 Tax=Mesorhizobium sp. TaxID=1871066 RepID=UPI000FE64275|nr:urea amidolyase family protein [Mesorhizobium sp.]RWK11051.1 MAG: 5-oxoprolinase/urea amidolyase family protein [Mesorhizobium sp.]TIQ49648.1 MAG: 5-oxoprolinase/urea amidolyase family protein [Mesorhizobium sp.]TIQ59349.1 MAG: 5-oxoprolinase/urea amidolyase family protein [Mesorhizobium sp.]TJV91039.1 MAG: 5-oxoprolinase/urea amidolyase family protein [Mesorhizobium sp.]
MAEHLRFLPAGSDAFLVELDDLAITLSLLGGLLAARPAGVIELVPAARTLMVRFDPFVTDQAHLVPVISRIDLSVRGTRRGQTFEIPVAYDGEDLVDVAETLGWKVEELIRRHTEATYTVAFTGFAPGFAYLTCDDIHFDVPRRTSPRVRIPAGSVALGGKFSGIYPVDSPGGWQLLGRTPLKMWDVNRRRAALLAPGDTVGFREIGKGAFFSVAVNLEKQMETAGPAAGLVVTRADGPVLYQDLGRPGRADQGVAESGALDRASLIGANLCVGNRRDAAGIEIVFGGFGLKADRPVTLAVTGAPAPISIRTADGRIVPAPFGRPFALDAGDDLTLGLPPEGMRSYLALRGGFAVEALLGSASSDTLARIGPAPITMGDLLVPANEPAASVDPFRAAQVSLPKAGETVTLDIVLGPRTDWFSDKGVKQLLSQKWQVTAESSRVGMRLAGAEPLQRRNAAELPSEGTAIGSIQVPHSGEPVIFLADHPLTGGYPVIGVVARHHLDLAGQIPIGANIRFNAIAAFDPLIMEINR